MVKTTKMVKIVQVTDSKKRQKKRTETAPLQIKKTEFSNLLIITNISISKRSLETFNNLILPIQIQTTILLIWTTHQATIKDTDTVGQNQYKCLKDICHKIT